MAFIKPFDVITSFYKDFGGQTKTNPDGSPQAGLFMVLKVDSHGTITCCKITSQSSYYNEFAYKLFLASHPFLQTDSYVLLDKIHTLSTARVTKVGCVFPRIRSAVLNRFRGFSSSVFASLRSGLEPYVSPNVSPAITDDGISEN